MWVRQVSFEVDFKNLRHCQVSLRGTGGYDKLGVLLRVSISVILSNVSFIYELLLTLSWVARDFCKLFFVFSSCYFTVFSLPSNGKVKVLRSS